MIAAIARQPVFRVPCTFAHLKSLVKDYLGYGNKMGEGWLLTGEMLELIDSGTSISSARSPSAACPIMLWVKEWCGRSKTVFRRPTSSVWLRSGRYPDQSGKTGSS